MNLFDISVKKAAIEHNIDAVTDTIILSQEGKDDMLPYMGRVAKMLPEVMDRIHAGMTREEIYAQIEYLVASRFAEAAEEMAVRIQHFEELTQKKLYAGVGRLLDLFALEYDRKQVFRCYLGFYNPFPRAVLDKKYWLHYDIADDIFLRASMHEIDHMILFDKWKSMHGYAKEQEPVYPDILWFLEELAVEPTLNDRRIQEIIPIRHEAYASLRAIRIAGEPLTQHIQRIYDSSPDMEAFLDVAYCFLEERSSICLADD